MTRSFNNPTFFFLFKYGSISRPTQMKFKGFVLTVSFLWVDGMALFPFILSRRSSPGKVFLNHECIHLRQQLELGVLLFYFWYIVEYLVQLAVRRDHLAAYYNISFEREAYRNERNTEYLTNRKFWSFMRYIGKEK